MAIKDVFWSYKIATSKESAVSGKILYESYLPRSKFINEQKIGYTDIMNSLKKEIEKSGNIKFAYNENEPPHFDHSEAYHFSEIENLAAHTAVNLFSIFYNIKKIDKLAINDEQKELIKSTLERCFNTGKNYMTVTFAEHMPAAIKGQQFNPTSNPLRIAAKTVAIKRKKELLSNGYSSTRANAVVQSEFENMPEYKEIFKDYGVTNWKVFLQESKIGKTR